MELRAVDLQRKKQMNVIAMGAALVVTLVLVGLVVITPLGSSVMSALGLGSKAIGGFDGLARIDPGEWQAPSDGDELKERVKRLLDSPDFEGWKILPSPRQGLSWNMNENGIVASGYSASMSKPRLMRPRETRGPFSLKLNIAVVKGKPSGTAVILLTRQDNAHAVFEIKPKARSERFGKLMTRSPQSRRQIIADAPISNKVWYPIEVRVGDDGAVVTIGGVEAMECDIYPEEISSLSITTNNAHVLIKELQYEEKIALDGL